MPPVKLHQVLRASLRENRNIVEALSTLQQPQITSVRDAEAVCECLKQTRTPEGNSSIQSDLRALAELFLGAKGAPAYQVLRNQGLSLLLHHFDRGIAQAEPPTDDLLFLLKTFAHFRFYDGANRVVSAARQPLEPESYQWSEIFDRFRGSHPHRVFVLEKLRDPLPGGFVAVAYLDFANTLCLEGRITRHPYNTSAGTTRLFEWLLSTDRSRWTRAVSAATALPFLRSPKREQFLEKALHHENWLVRFEAAWARAYLKQEEAAQELAEYCRDPRLRQQAVKYLQALGRRNDIPAADAQQEAAAELCGWLATSHECGCPPDAIELVDQRQMHWPPTKDERRLWLFRYRYDGFVEGQEPRTGLGLAGSICYSLYNRVSVDTPPEEVYALHCHWETQYHERGKVPESVSLEAGQRILAGKPAVAPEETTAAS